MMHCMMQYAPVYLLVQFIGAELTLKKSISVLLIALLLISLAPFSAFASSADGVNIESLDTELIFSKMQLAKFHFRITNSGAKTGAKADFFIDGYHQAEETVNYFELTGENTENFDIYIPPMIDAGVSHTLTMRLKLSDGSLKEISVPFKVHSKLPEMKAELISHPLSVTPDTEIYYAVKFTFSDNRYGYRLRSLAELNGVQIPELSGDLYVGSGEVKYYTVPASLTRLDLYNYEFKLTLNPDAGYGEKTFSAEKSVPMMGEKGKQKAEINELIKPVLIRAYVKRDLAAYSYASLTGYQTTIPMGTYVTYMNPDNHESMRSAKIRTDDGAVYWVDMSGIMIVTGKYAIPDELTNEQKELFVNANGYDSETAYLIWVNLERQRLNVFLGSKGNWKIVNSFPIASGKNSTPTPTVQHRIEYVTRWVTDSYICYPVLALYDGYAIHNQPQSHSGYVIDSTIGSPASAGCVRMLKEHIDWVHAFVPVKTNVVIH